MSVDLLPVVPTGKGPMSLGPLCDLAESRRNLTAEAIDLRPMQFLRTTRRTALPCDMFTGLTRLQER